MSLLTEQYDDGSDDNSVLIKWLGRCDYQQTLQAMHDFTNARHAKLLDQIWLVEHEAVFTQGQAGKAHHILAAGDIPVVQSDRGGQVTYHGPGQLVVYFLLDLRRKSLNVRQLVSKIEQIVIETLADFSVQAQAKSDAPGVYVGEKKICSLGLRIRKGCSFHGLALNVAMDLSPFLRINPCGYAQMQMAQLSDYGEYSLEDVTPVLLQHVQTQLHYQNLTYEFE